MWNKPSETRKKVLIELTFKLITEVPDNWGKDETEFWLNESSHCLSSELHELMSEELRASPGCCNTCHRASGVYVRDASVEDIDSYQAKCEVFPKEDRHR